MRFDKCLILLTEYSLIKSFKKKTVFILLLWEMYQKPEALMQ